ncbi:MAG: hypothetical protein R3B06_03380 [Kofleriaceae bacterium]
MGNITYEFSIGSAGTMAKAEDQATFMARIDPATKRRARWWLVQPGWGYDAYPVNFVARDDAKGELTFKFVDCAKPPATVGGPHVVALADHELMFPARPSTIPTKAEIDAVAGGLFGFVMLNPHRLTAAHKADLVAAQADNPTADGKWPRTAGLSQIQFNALKKAVLAKVAEAKLTGVVDLVGLEALFE